MSLDGVVTSGRAHKMKIPPFKFTVQYVLYACTPSGLIFIFASSSHFRVILSVPMSWAEAVEPVSCTSSRFAPSALRLHDELLSFVWVEERRPMQNSFGSLFVK